MFVLCEKSLYNYGFIPFPVLTYMQVEVDPGNVGQGEGTEQCDKNAELRGCTQQQGLRIGDERSKIGHCSDTHGIKEDDISTENLSLYTEYKWENNKQTRVGESCSQTLAVKLRDLPKLGEVIDQLGKVDAISLDSIRFDKADKNGDYAEARRKAAADAREKATVYASSFNMVLGTPLTITEGTSYSQPVYRNAKVAATMAIPSVRGSSHRNP